ncbi:MULTISPECIES: hypothetical protein [unclassified Sphingobacterium]|uniref:hypothetical protein n=1 Tax=unclassified Sphingobacterium TaxID=2609468 RepID=UPI0025ED3C5B|nr:MULTISPECIES: hypothetical protein [unclassified Sphingobacterium]
MSKLKTCAYCDKEGPMTREHIWPKCIIERMPDLTSRYVGSQNKYISGELVIADVCAECNNKKLSDLDAHLCLLFDRYFHQFQEISNNFEFEYDYDMLMRCLLKITYNSSRTIIKENNPFAKYRKVILDGGVQREDIIIKLDLVIPSNEEGIILPPHSARCASIDTGRKLEHFIIRCIAINSFYFYIILSKKESVESNVIEELKFVMHNVPGVIVHPYRSKIIVDDISGKNTRDTHEHFIYSTKDSYEAFLKKRK